MTWFDRFIDLVGFSDVRNFEERSSGRWSVRLIDRSDTSACSRSATGLSGQEATIDREYLAEVRSAIVSVLDWLDGLDPTPLGLAQAAANVTDIDSRRN